MPLRVGLHHLPLLTEADLLETLMYLHLPTVVGHRLANQML